MERIFCTSHFLPMRNWLIYPVTSTAKTSAFGHRLTHMSSTVHLYMSRRLVCTLLCHIMKSDNLQWHYQLGALLRRDSLPFHRTCKWGWYCPWLLPTGCCYCTHSHDDTVPCVQAQNNFKGYFPHLTPLDYYLWGTIKGAVYKCSLYILELMKAVINFIRNILLIGLSCVLANKIRCVDACLQAHEGHFQHLL